MNDDTQKRIKALEDRLAMLESSFSIPLKVDQAFQGRGFVKSATGKNNMFLNSPNSTGILNANGTTVSAITPLSGSHTFYAAPSSGAAATVKLTFNSGILTADT